MDQPILTETEFGDSQFGKRLNYDRPKYRDPVFAVIYILHVLAIIGLTIYFWAVAIPASSETHYSGSGVEYDLQGSWGGILTAVFSCIAAGILFGLCWLQIIKRFASMIIKAMLWLNITVWIAVGVVGLLQNVIALATIGFLVAGIYALWTWCIWSRIPFASALLSISSTIVSRFGGTIVISLAAVLFNIFWIILWICGFVGYLQATTQLRYDEYGYETYDEPSNWIIFVFLVSLYWGLQVNKNISHTTTCGVAATWYFTTSISHKPTPAAFKRTMTTSFGSVCLGSLIVAILQAIRAMVRAARNNRNALITCLAYCLLQCIESLIRYFNKYAYAQCAIYGSSFIESAKATWNLFLSKGILALINDDLTGMALMCGMFVSGIVSAGVGFGCAYGFYGNNPRKYESMAIGFAVYGFIIGMVMCGIVLQVIASAVVTLFVCYAEDPAALNDNHPEEFNRIASTKQSFADVLRMNTGPRQPIAGQQHQVVVEAVPTRV